MKENKEKQKNARNSLEKIKPVAPVGVIADIRTRFGRDKNPVNRMKQQWQKNAENLDKYQIRNMMNVFDRIIKDLRSAH